MNKGSFFYILFPFLLLITGCDKESSFFHPNHTTEVLIDSKVIGIEYKNMSNTYTTNKLGEFTFTKDSTVSFHVGNVYIGELSTLGLRDDKKRFIQELTGRSDLRDTNNTQTINIAVFLQSLDNDDNLTNGITLSNDCITNFHSISAINIQESNESTIDNLISLCNKTARSREDALLHLNTTMTQHGIDLTPPKVLSLSVINSPANDASTILYEIVFDENISNISKDDFTLTFSGTTSAQVDSISNTSGNNIEIIISNIKGDGTLQLSLKNTHQITDNATNRLLGGFIGDSHTNTSPPKILSISQPDNNTYKQNDSLDFNISISENIIVSSLPRLTLNIGGETKYATYQDGNNSNYLFFKYTIESNLTDLDGITLDNKIDLNSGAIKDSGGNDLNTTFTSLDLSQIFVDSKKPNIVSINLLDSPASSTQKLSYRIVFDENISNIKIEDFILNVTNTTTATIDSISGSLGDTFDINITNIGGDGTLQLVLDSNNSISDLSGNLLAQGFSGEVHTNFINPYIQSISIPENKTYVENEHLDFNLTISENIFINTTSSRLLLNIDGNTKYATYHDGNGTNYLLYRYTIENNISDMDGISLTNEISLNGSSIKDSGGMDLNRSFESQDLSNIKIDSVKPYITSITIPQNGYYKNNDTLTFILNINEEVNVTNTPYFKLTIDSNEKNVTYQSGTGTTALEFTYNVQNNIEDKNGLSSDSTISFDGATIKDKVGNNIISNLPSIDLSNIFIDSIAPRVTKILNDQNGTHGTGANLDFNLTISEEVNVTGSPQIKLYINGVSSKYVTYNLGESNSTNLVFKYIVEADIEDYDGLDLNDTIELNGGSIKDLASNDINLSIGTITLANVDIDSKAPTFDNNSSISICENQKELIQLSATDNAPSISFSLQNTQLDTNLSEINGSDFLSFKNAPDYETPLDSGANNIYELIISATDTYSNERNQTFTATIIDQEDESNLHIKKIVYDDNLTTSVDDDTLYLYFSKPIDENSLDLNDLNSMFTINGNGDFNNSTATYSETLFNSIKVELASSSAVFDINDTNLSIKPNTIKDKCGVYPTDYNETKVTIFKYVLQTDLDWDGYDNSGTGGTGSRDDGYYDAGYDRNYSRDDINKTVTLYQTQLMWQDDLNVTNDWNDSVTYCSNLNLDSFSDWRLPKITELTQLLHYRKSSSGWIDTTYFKNHQKNSYWSITHKEENNASNTAWKVNFSTGETLQETKTVSMNVRCVRDINTTTESEETFIKDSNGDIIIDTQTGLIWQNDTDIRYDYKTDSSNRDYWVGSIFHCENLSLGGITNWRLPNINELKRMIDYSIKDPAIFSDIDQTMWNTLNTINYWSSTTHAGEPNKAWYINFYNGISSFTLKDGSDTPAIYARCVSNR